MGQQKEADQTEKPTPKRLKDARKQGQIHQSKDLTLTILLLLWLLMFAFFSSTLFEHFKELFTAVFQHVATPSNAAIVKILHLAGTILLYLSLIFVIPAAIVGMLAVYLQIGPVLAFQRLVPKLETLNPAEGLKRILSIENLVEVLKAIVKTVALVTIVIIVTQSLLSEYLVLPYGPLTALFATYWQSIIWIGTGIIFVFFFISVLDVAYQRHVFMKNMMMSKRDIKQEHKESEGDPMVKGQRKQLQKEWTQQNTVFAARKANVIVTNPTHLAVAIRYQQDETDLPIVVAKGEGFIARLIREEAESADIPVMQNIDLARGLYQDIAVDSYITSDYFGPVIELLKWAETVSQGD